MEGVDCLSTSDSGRPVGRITAQIDHLYQERHGDAAGYFGSLDCIDDEQVFVALTTAAESWLVERGMKHVFGPFNLGINQEIGQLIRDLTPRLGS